MTRDDSLLIYIDCHTQTYNINLKNFLASRLLIPWKMYIILLPFETTFHATITELTIKCYYQSSLQKFQYKYGKNVGVIGECTLYLQLL